MIFFHDENGRGPTWSCTICQKKYPAEFLQEWRLEGVASRKRESSELVSDARLFEEGGLEKASTRNGVLTAIEDFVREQRDSYRLFVVHAGAGLGVMQYRGRLKDQRLHGFAVEGFVWST